MTRIDEFPPVEEIVYHGGCVLLLDRILAHSEQETIVSVDVSKQTWLTLPQGGVSSWLAIEFMAQCFAAHEGLISYYENRALPHGFLIGVNHLQLHTPQIDVDAKLRVGTRPLRGRPGLGALSHIGSIHLEDSGSEGALLAEGRLSIATQIRSS